MKHGARNDLAGTVTEIQVGESGIMAQAKVALSGDFTVGSVMTKDSLEALGLAVGDNVRCVVKAIHVLVVKDE